jgi:uncharacterized protein
MFPSFVRWVVSKPRMTLLIVALLSLVVLAGARNTHFDSDFDSSLPAKSPLTAQIHAIQDIFQSRNTLAFLVSGPTEKARIAAACSLSAALETMPGIAAGRIYGVGANSLKYVTGQDQDLSATGLAEVCNLPNGLSADILEGLGPQREMIIAPKGDLVVYADTDVVSGELGPLLAKIDAIITTAAQGEAKIAYSGQPAFLAQNDIFSKRIVLFFPLIMALVLALHWEALRSVQAVIVPIFTGLAATLLGLGMYGWLKQPLDTYTVLAPVLILAVGAGHSVQLLKRYMEEVAARWPAGDRTTREVSVASVEATLIAMGPVLALAVLGASACLFALTLLDVSALARFGLLAGIGIIFALILELTVVPAIRVLLRPPFVRAGYGELSGFWQHGIERLGLLAVRGPKRPVLAGLAIVCVLLGIGIANVKPSHSMSVYTSPDVPVQKTLTALSQAGIGPYVLDVMVDTGKPDGAFDPAIQSAVSGLATKLEADPSVRAILSPTSIIGFLKCRFANAPSCVDQRAQTTGEAQQIWTVLFGGGQEVGLIDESGRYLRLRAFTSTDETQVANRLVKTVQSFASENSLQIQMGGSAITAKALADGIVRVSLEKALLLVIVVALIGAVVFRSLLVAFLFAVPSALTIATNFAWLGWTGTTLNVATAAVATIAVGVGFDYLVYLTFRVREFLIKGRSFDEALLAGHASAGGAAVCVAVAVAVGYAVLIFSPGYLVHHWIAALVPMTMIASLIGALFVFPFLLRLFKPRLVGSTATLATEWQVKTS